MACGSPDAAGSRAIWAAQATDDVEPFMARVRRAQVQGRGAS